MKKTFSKRILAAVLSTVMLSSAVISGGAWAANVEETPGLQLQTILIDNDGKNWTTENWGGQNMTPNTSWTTLLLGDYYENGYLNFEVKNNNSSTVEFNIGLTSKKHNEQVRIYWTDMEEYQDISADADWTSYSLPIKDLVDANPDSGFDLDNFLLVYVNGVPSGNTLAFQNMTITSTDDERQYPLIKVNQVGYYCDGAKTACVSYFEKFGSLNSKTYEIVNADNGEVVYTDTLPDAVYEKNFSGEMMHTISFDEVTEPGTYYIRIPDAGLDESARSPYDAASGLELDTLTSVKFEISNNVYDDLLNDLTKYYYYQRQGIEIEEKYAGIFARENLHPDDITVKKWSDRDNPNAETFDVSGGWYDAGDYGKYVSSGANSVSDLLFAYEMNPGIFADLEMNIPETDPDNPNYADAPGILSEVKYELDMLLKLEHSSKDGSFYTAANYSNDVIYIEDTLYKTSNHESDASERELRCHLATADMAAVLAHAYIVYKDIPVYADFAEQCLETSLRAWDWINDPANKLNMSIGAANRTYTFNESDFERSRFQAAGTIYRALTLRGEDAGEYEEYLLANCTTENVTNCFKSASIGYGHGGKAFLGFFHYLYGNEAPAQEIKNAFSEYETWRTRMLKYDTWGLEMPGWGFWWGSNKYVAQSAITLMLGDIVTYGEVQEDVQTAIDKHVHYLLGVNPISFSYVSGYGENSVENIFSAIYSKDAKLDPYQCPAGYFTEGANDSNNPHLSKFTGKCFMDSDGEWTTNENTIYGNAAMIFLTASMMSQNEPEKVRGDVNADGSFTAADVVALQKWLLCVPDTKLADWQAGDLCEDEKLDVFDLCIMKRELLNK
ncbi:MAG: glycoside hydrolase family 9 protein [Oscillospiraceae bacterium]|nr:glycoside hydrolase family 9 protein [Oscillospiraceae bacterium]